MSLKMFATQLHKSNPRLRSHICNNSGLYAACGGHFVHGAALTSCARQRRTMHNPLEW
jgi:hypothetical protein